MSVADERVAPSLFLRPELPQAALHGVFGRLVETVRPTTEADDAAVLLTSMAMFGNAVGPSPSVWFGNADHGARMFVLLVGTAGAGRKGTAVGVVKAIMKEAAPEWAATRMMSGLKSGEAVITTLQLDSAGKGDPRLFIDEDEYQRLIVTMGRSGSMGPMLRSAWAGLKLEDTTKKKKVQSSEQTHVSMVAAITPQELLARKDAVTRAGGLESRLLFALVHKARTVSPFVRPADTTDIVQELREAILNAQKNVLLHVPALIRELCQLKGVFPEMQYQVAPEVMDNWQELVRDRLPMVDPQLDKVAERAEPQIIRMALIYALADQAAEIGVEHINAAVALWTYCIRSAENILTIPFEQAAPKAGNDQVAKLLVGMAQARKGALACFRQVPTGEKNDEGKPIMKTEPYTTDADGWLSQSEITRSIFKGNTKADEAQTWLDELGRKVAIECRTTATAGRPRVEYRLAARA